MLRKLAGVLGLRLLQYQRTSLPRKLSERLSENIFPCLSLPWNGSAVCGVSGLSFAQTVQVFLTGGTVVGAHLSESIVFLGVLCSF